MHRTHTRLVATYILFVLLLGCKSTNKSDFNNIVFDVQLQSKDSLEVVCVLSETMQNIGSISDFAMLNDSLFVVADSKAAYLYSTSGGQKRQLGFNGRAKGEMLTPISFCASDRLIYVWCSTLMKIVVFNFQGEFISEYSGFDRAVKKMAVDNDLHIVLYTSGTLDIAEMAFENVISIFDIEKGETINSFGLRKGEDEILSALSNAAGISLSVIDKGLLYINPGNLIIFKSDIKGDNIIRYKIEDIQFVCEKIENFRDITDNMNVWIDFIRKNSVVRWLGEDNRNIVVMTNVGSFGDNNIGTRQTKFYILDNQMKPLKSVLCNYEETPNIDIRDGFVYYITTSVNINQRVSLNRFSLAY